VFGTAGQITPFDIECGERNRHGGGSRVLVSIAAPSTM
jgi:hypothetical protein